MFFIPPERKKTILLLWCDKNLYRHHYSWHIGPIFIKLKLSLNSSDQSNPMHDIPWLGWFGVQHKGPPPTWHTWAHRSWMRAHRGGLGAWNTKPHSKSYSAGRCSHPHFTRELALQWQCWQNTRSTPTGEICFSWMNLFRSHIFIYRNTKCSLTLKKLPSLCKGIYQFAAYRWPTDMQKDAQYTQSTDANKTTKWYHPTPIRMAIIHNQQVLVRMQRKGNVSALLVGMQVGAATVESCMEIPRKISKWTCLMTLQYHFWEVVQRNPKTLIQKYLYTPMFTAALVTITKIWKQPKCPIRFVDK